MERPSDLRPICQAGKESDPAWYRIHRQVSIHLTWALLHTRITPNQISLAMMGVTAVGAWLLAATNGAMNAAGFALLYFGFLLDKCDGEVARYRGVQSVRGVLIDRIHHLLLEPAVVFAAGWHVYRETASPTFLVVALIAIVIGNVIEEQTHWAAYALLKHLRVRQPLGPSSKSANAKGLRRVSAWFRALKAFRMFIVVLPSLALVYGLERATAAPWVEGYLVLMTAALAVYLIFQSYYYFALQFESEIDEYRPFVVAGAIPGDLGITDLPETEGLRQRVRPHPARQRIHTDRPGMVSGVEQ